MLRKLSGPAVEPVTLAEAKLAAKIDDSERDALVGSLITAAREAAEQATGRLFGEQVWSVELPDWPAADTPLPVCGPTAVTTSHWTGAGWSSPAALPEARWAALGTGTVVAAPDDGWPALGVRAVGPRVRVNITAGQAAEEQVKLFIKATVTHWLQSPAAAQAGALAVNPLFLRLLDRATVY